MGVIVALALFAVVVAEIAYAMGVGIPRLPPVDAVFEPVDDERVYAPKPLSMMKIRGWTGEAAGDRERVWAFDAYGARGTVARGEFADAGRCRIALVGGNTVFGAHVLDNETIGARLEARFAGLEVFNVGVPGVGLGYVAAHAEKVVPKLHAHVVILVPDEGLPVRHRGMLMLRRAYEHRATLTTLLLSVFHSMQTTDWVKPAETSEAEVEEIGVAVGRVLAVTKQTKSRFLLVPTDANVSAAILLSSKLISLRQGSDPFAEVWVPRATGTQAFPTDEPTIESMVAFERELGNYLEGALKREGWCAPQP